MPGKFITFEGIDGSGKSTQMRMLVDSLCARGVDVVATFEPGGTSLGRRLREVFLEAETKVAPMAELLLFAADRAQHVEHLIKPSIAAGRTVISDRYADATFAYQGAGRGFDVDTVNEVIRLATGGLRPDLTLYFDIPIETAFERRNARHDDERPNRMDFETAEFYERVRQAYLGIAEREPERFLVLSASGTVDAIHAQVVALVDEFLSL